MRVASCHGHDRFNVSAPEPVARLTHTIGMLTLIVTCASESTVRELVVLSRGVREATLPSAGCERMRTVAKGVPVPVIGRPKDQHFCACPVGRDVFVAISETSC